MKSKLSVLICSLIFVAFSLNAQEMNLKEAAKLAKVNAKALNKAGVKKIMFIEFYGDFVTSKETSPSTMANRYGSVNLKPRYESLEISDDYYETATNEIYEIVKEVFTDNGIEVLDKSILLENEDYIALGLKEEKKRREYTGGLTKNSVTSQTVRRSVTGMGMWSETVRIAAVSKIKKLIPKIANDNGCQASVITRFRIGMGKNGAPTLAYLKSVVDYEIGSYGKGEKEAFFFKKGGLEMLNSKSDLKTKNSIVGDNGEVDMELYHSSIMNMVSTMSEAFTVQLKDQLGK